MHLADGHSLFVWLLPVALGLSALDARSCGGSSDAPLAPSAPAQPTSPPSSGAFVCTEVIGFPQTREWFLDVPQFEQTVGSASWQLLWTGGADVEQWANPAFSGWAGAKQSSCTAGSREPGRVVLTITGGNGNMSDVAWWTARIGEAIATTRSKYPSAARMLLQPVIGGPGHATCTYAGMVVQASFNHPFIDQAIANLVGGDVAAGMSPEVRTCADYRDSRGHIDDDALPAISLAIGQYYAANP